MKSRPVRRRLPGVLFALGVLACNASQAAQTVAPVMNTTTEGNSSDGGTFGEGGGGDFRMQSVYSTSEFLSFGGPFLITGITFRPDASPLGGGDSSGWSATPINLNMLIRMSTTNKSVDGLSLAFADNIGANQTTVVNGNVQVSSSNALVVGGSTKAFDIVITFTTPFVYNPSLGNLLVDSRTISGGNRRSHTVDGVSILGDTVSSVRTGFGNGGSAVAVGGDTYGTILQFAISPVPESSAFALMCLGLVGINAALGRKCRRKALTSPSPGAA